MDRLFTIAATSFLTYYVCKGIVKNNDALEIAVAVMVSTFTEKYLDNGK